MSFFALFQLPVCFSIDILDLEKRYKQLALTLHPDRFVIKSPAEQQLAALKMADVQQGYATLKNPYLRALHLLELAGVSLQTTINDPSLLMEMMELSQGDKSTIPDKITATLIDLKTAFDNNMLENATNLTYRLRFLENLKNHAVTN